VKAVPVIDLSDAAAATLRRMLESGRVIGRDGAGRRVLEVAVDDWVIDWFGTRRPSNNGNRQRRL
jgi:rRNA processing protein Krr1/Pno1